MKYQYQKSTVSIRTHAHAGYYKAVNIEGTMSTRLSLWKSCTCLQVGSRCHRFRPRSLSAKSPNVISGAGVAPLQRHTQQLRWPWCWQVAHPKLKFWHVLTCFDHSPLHHLGSKIPADNGGKHEETNWEVVQDFSHQRYDHDFWFSSQWTKSPPTDQQGVERRVQLCMMASASAKPCHYKICEGISRSNAEVKVTSRQKNRWIETKTLLFQGTSNVILELLAMGQSYPATMCNLLEVLGSFSTSFTSWSLKC